MFPWQRKFFFSFFFHILKYLHLTKVLEQKIPKKYQYVNLGGNTTLIHFYVVLSVFFVVLARHLRENELFSNL